MSILSNIRESLELSGIEPIALVIDRTTFVSATARVVDFSFRASGVKMRHLDLLRDQVNTSRIDFGNGDAERSVFAGNLNIRVQSAWVLDIGE